MQKGEYKGIDFTVDTQKKDDRTNKDYRVSIHFRANVKFEDVDVTHLKDLLEELTEIEALDHNLYIDTSYNYGRTIVITSVIRKDRPKDLPDIKHCENKFLLIAPQICEAICDAKYKKDEQKHLEKLTHTVSSLMSWFGSESAERAKKVVRWKQRLAALEAELQEEMRVQMSTLKDEVMSEENMKELLNDWSQEVLDVTNQALEDNEISTRFCLIPTRRGIPFRSDVKVEVEEVRKLIEKVKRKENND